MLSETWPARPGATAQGQGAMTPLLDEDRRREHKARNRRVEFDIEEIEGGPAEGGTTPCAPNSFRRAGR